MTIEGIQRQFFLNCLRFLHLRNIIKMVSVMDGIILRLKEANLNMN